MGKFLSLLSGLILFGAISSSSHYQLQSFSVNSGGSNTTQSTNYKARATVGEVTNSFAASTTYATFSGSVAAGIVSDPACASVTNGNNTYYNKLNYKIVPGTDSPSDETYAIAFSTSPSMSPISYVQSDDTLGATAYYQSYSAWGGSSGTMVIGLAPNTNYYTETLSKESIFGSPLLQPGCNEQGITVNPSLSFSLNNSIINLGSLNAGSLVSNPSLGGTFSTNASNGGYIYVSGTSVGLTSAATGYTISVSPPSGDLSALSEGFGIGNGFVSGGLSAQAPYNGVSNVVGAVYTTFVPIYSASSPVSSGAFGVSLSAKAANTTPAASDYTDTLTFVAAANY